MKRIGSIFIIIFAGCISVLFGQKTQNTDSNAVERQAYIQKHKPLAFLKAIAFDGKVEITFNKSKWYPANEDYNDLFDTIRIYRKQVDFNFYKDGKEFFDGITCSDADIIYKGFIKQEKNKPYLYNDKTVSLGDTYVYWVAAAKGDPTGPYPIKVRDPRIWWSQSKISEEMHNLQKSYPELVKVTVAGKTRKNKDILGIEVGKSNKKVALLGAAHASESGPEIIIPVIKLLLEDNKEIFNNSSIIAIPCINLDERQSAVDGTPWYLRRNVIGVDLNRNFPGNWEEISYLYGGSSANPGGGTYRGPAPASEPETEAVVSFLKEHQPSVVLSFHHLASVAGRCLWAPKAAAENKAVRENFQKIYNIYVEGYCRDYSDEDPNHNWLKFSATPGSIPLWCFKEFGIQAFDVEWAGHPTMEKSLTDETDVELLERNQKQNAAGILNLMKNLKD
ncbi:MAG: hypothetical protein A2Y10_03115 [Planctomycetes bacterium GWF2_41_51]|nr:MAG: hypothetical protein A2Y10_03115 [Planctomycetes bacterium GWF2_41_51]HBG26053.1 hypothetical protein [Phycisphaerales bacterium]